MRRAVMPNASDFRPGPRQWIKYRGSRVCPLPFDRCNYVKQKERRADVALWWNLVYAVFYRRLM